MNRKDVESVVRRFGWNVKTSPSGMKFAGDGSHKTWISPDGLSQITVCNSTKIGTLKGIEKELFYWMRITKTPLKKGYVFAQL